MSWSPNDLVTDDDLLGYERTIITQFNQEDHGWQTRRQKALEDWLFPLLEGRGFPPHALRTRFEPVSVFGYTSSAFTDRTSAAKTADGLNLATILAASSDYLYIGSDVAFRGLSIRMHDSVSAVAGTLSLACWTDAWQTPEALVNGCQAQTVPFANGGAITWTLPETLVRRTVSTSDPLFWVRLSVSAAQTGALAGPVSVIRRSRLCACVTLRTLALIFREAPVGQDGPWREKAEWYEAEADRAWLRVADQIGGEFDMDGDDAISDTEQSQTAAEVNQGGFRWERY